MTPVERQELVADIAAALAQSKTNELTEEERQWVRLAIAAEARKIKFRDAVIEKSLGALTIAAISGFGYIILDFLRNHGLKL
jgi:hypothetical protein